MTLSQPPALPRQFAPQATSDDGLVRLWLDCYRAANTRRAYAGDIAGFRRFVRLPLRSMTIGDVQAFGASLDPEACATNARRLSAVKSLVKFGHRVGYLPFDVAAPVQLPAIKDRLSERILSEEQVQRLFIAERNPRNSTLFRVVYGAGLRASEALSLTWADLVERDDAEGQLTVMGKGGKTRAVLLPAGLWQRLEPMRGGLGPSEPVFRTRAGRRISYALAYLIMKRAVRRAGLPSTITLHALRHSHVTHALNRGCPVHIVSQTVGHSNLATTGRYAHMRPGDSSARYLAT